MKTEFHRMAVGKNGRLGFKKRDAVFSVYTVFLTDPADLHSLESKLHDVAAELVLAKLQAKFPSLNFDEVRDAMKRLDLFDLFRYLLKSN